MEDKGSSSHTETFHPRVIVSAYLA